MKLTPCKLKEIVREEISKLAEQDDENPYTGWENLPPGWDEESLKSFAQSLTGQEGEEGFFTACMDKMEDEMEDAERFCASLKDEYLDREDWRVGRGGEEQNEEKLTRRKLNQIIKEEVRSLREAPETEWPPYDQFDRFFQRNGMQVDEGIYMYKDFFFHLDSMAGMGTLFVNVFRDRYDSESLVSAKIEGDRVTIQKPSPMKGGRPKTANIKFRSAEQVAQALLERARGDMGSYGEYR